MKCSTERCPKKDMEMDKAIVLDLSDKKFKWDRRSWHCYCGYYIDTSKEEKWVEVR